MKIGGIQKTSLLDYPDTISAIIWAIGCNFRCPFCYNKDLVFGKVATISEEEVLSFLEKRKGMLEGLVISGGEPLMQDDILSFTEKVKKMGYLLKIDTNGMYPEMLKKLIDRKLVDYIAMDVKAPKNKYESLSGVKTDIKKIEKSIEIIRNSSVNYEFKTTFAPDLLTREDIIEIAKWLKGSKRFYLQQFNNEANLISSRLQNSKPYLKDELIDTLKDIKPYFEYCDVRGI
jgi:pyruvate formate lyase activating enzyme